MRSSILLSAALALLPAAAAGQAQGAAQAFRSIELRGGGTVTVRHGPAHLVTVRSGGADRAIRHEGDRLVIDRCRRPCRGGHRIEVEIVTPQIAGLAVTDGGRIQLAGGFPSQPELAAAVSSGGMIDMRPLAAARVTAAVSQGGGILATPGRELTAAVSNGGIITYWGDPKVTSSIRHGGAIVRGAAADRHAPLASLDRGMPAPPAPPRVPRAPKPGH